MFDAPGTPLAPAAPEETRLPLTAAQAGMWAGRQFDPVNPAYTVAGYVEIHGPVDPPLFERALRQTVAETDALHTRFAEESGDPWQYREPPSDAWPMTFVDLVAEDDPMTAAEAWMAAESARPIDPLRGPLFTEALLRVAPELFLWFQRCHHLVMDGFGVQLMARRVAELYTAAVGGAPALPRTFGSVLRCHEEDSAYRASERFTEDLHHWTERLEDWPEVTGLAGRQAPASHSALRRTAQLSAPEAGPDGVVRRHPLQRCDGRAGHTDTLGERGRGGPRLPGGHPAAVRGRAAHRRPGRLPRTPRPSTGQRLRPHGDHRLVHRRRSDRRGARQ